jgi:LuxR family maltose regulon positive regulatory protein
MADVLIATKLQIPRVRAERVIRPRLLDRLNSGLGCPLTLVSAPAGFGKTTLLAEWVAKIDRPSAWLSLDEHDSDPVRFMIYFIRALQQIEDEAGASTLAFISEAVMPARVTSFLPPLVNDIHNIPEAFVIVLDDYYLVTDRGVHEALAFLIEHQPEPMHLVIVSRADPPLPLARLRARGQLGEIRQADLRFTALEAEEVLNQALGSRLMPSQVGMLTERTEGWIAALQMASLTLQALIFEAGSPPGGVEAFIQTFGGAHRHVADFLVEEVLARQSEEVHFFLLWTSILDRLSGPLCDALLADPMTPAGQAQAGSGQQMLEHLERANLFIEPLDDRREWYRYHRLFADLLRLRLREATQATPSVDRPIDIAPLHRRVSAWYKANSMLPEAIQHALRAADYEEAAGLIEQEAPFAWCQGELSTLLRWLETLPADARRNHPMLSIYLATIRFLRADSLVRVEALVEEASEHDLTGLYAGEISLLQAILGMYRGEIRAGLVLAQEAVERVPEESHFRGLATRVLSALHLLTGDLAAAEQLLEQDLIAGERTGDRLGLSASVRRLGSLAFLRGELRKAKIYYQRALELSRDSGGRLWPVAGRIVIHLAELALERNELEAAEALLNQASDLLENFIPGWNSESYVLLARLEHARGRAEYARAAMQAALERARTTETSMDDVYLEILAARLAIWQGDLVAAERWVSQCTSASESRSVSAAGDLEGLIRSRLFREIGRTTLARYYLVRGEPAQAVAVLEPPLADLQGRSMWGNRVELLALRALAHQAQGNTAQAQLDLEQALELAEPEGFVRTFVEEGEPMRCLLVEAAQQGRAREYALYLLMNMEAGAQPPLSDRGPSLERTGGHPSLVEPLTEREMEVLRFLQTSLTTPEIASEMGIAPSTVRTFVKNVYGKLGVHRRLDAIEQAKVLGLLRT